MTPCCASKKRWRRLKDRKKLPDVPEFAIFKDDPNFELLLAQDPKPLWLSRGRPAQFQNPRGLCQERSGQGVRFNADAASNALKWKLRAAPSSVTEVIAPRSFNSRELSGQRGRIA